MRKQVLQQSFVKKNTTTLAFKFNPNLKMDRTMYVTSSYSYYYKVVICFKIKHIFNLCSITLKETIKYIYLNFMSDHTLSQNTIT